VAAKYISAYLPRSFFDTADRQTLSALDRLIFKPSELDAQLQSRVRQHLQGAIDAHPAQAITLQFRKGGKLGPNAFALPGGTIFFTDELIRLAEHDDEILGVMAHEIGHVVYQHAMRRMVQDSLLSFALLALTGDASGVSELFLGLPVVLTELAYSRGFEREADQYALAYLQSHDIAPGRFADLLTRIDKSHKEQASADKEEKWTGYLATHPPTPDRVKTFWEVIPRL
jgi:Zn-dependent protease with chaperone function